MEDIAKATPEQSLAAFSMLPKRPDGSSVHGNKEDAEAFADDMNSFAIQEAPPQDEPEPAWVAAMLDHAEKAVSMIREKALGIAKAWSGYVNDSSGERIVESDEEDPNYDERSPAQQHNDRVYGHIRPTPSQLESERGDNNIPFALPQDSMVLKADVGDRLDKETRDGYLSGWTNSAPEPYMESSSAREVDLDSRFFEQWGEASTAGIVRPHHVADKSIHVLSALADAHDEAVKCMKLCKSWKQPTDEERFGDAERESDADAARPEPSSTGTSPRDLIRAEDVEMRDSPPGGLSRYGYDNKQRLQEGNLIPFALPQDAVVTKGPFTQGYDERDLESAHREHADAFDQYHGSAQDTPASVEGDKRGADSWKIIEDNRPVGLKALHAMRDHCIACKSMIRGMTGDHDRDDEAVPFNNEMVPSHSDDYSGRAPSEWYSPIDHSMLEGGDPQATIEIELPGRPSQADTNPGGRSKSVEGEDKGLRVSDLVGAALIGLATHASNHGSYAPPVPDPKPAAAVAPAAQGDDEDPDNTRPAHGIEGIQEDHLIEGDGGKARVDFDGLGSRQQEAEERAPRDKSLRLHPSEHGHSLKALAKAYREAHKAQAMIEGVIEKAYSVDDVPSHIRQALGDSVDRYVDDMNDPKTMTGAGWKPSVGADERRRIAEAPSENFSNPE